MLFLGLSVLSGVLLAATILPLAGGMGMVARNTSDHFQDLPEDVVIPPLPQRSRILAADGSLLAVFYEQNRVDVRLARVAPVMRQAVIAIEDARFYQHGGVDIKGTVRALVTNARAGDIEQGGSSLTQQYVKNVLIERAGEDREAVEAARAQNFSRKLQELRYAIGLEKKYSKDQILERYLNISYFGASAYGVEAAARRYFSVPATKLNLQQAALLAGTIQKPVAYDPLRNPEAARTRRNIVLDRMADLGYISPEQAAKAKRAKLGLRPKEPTNGCVTSQVAFFCDYVLNVIKNDPVFGKRKEDRVKLLLRGGLTIRTTLDRKAQKAATKAVRNGVEAKNRVATAIAMVQPGTGDIKAMAVNRTFGKGRGKTTVNYAADHAYGGSSGFQAGSTFKPFVLATAIEQGIPLSTRFNAPSQVHMTGKFRSCDGGRLKDEWDPTNYGDNSYGSLDMRQATWRSVNTYFVQLEQRTGVCKPPGLAEKMGVRRADGDPLSRFPPFVLGVDNVSPLSMAEAYATFGARGVHCESRAITGVTDRNGKKLRVPERKCDRVMDAGVADTVNMVLQGVIDGPDPNRTGAAVSLGRPAAGKTGTTDNAIAVWFSGYTPDMAAAVWVGDPRGNDTKYALRDVRIRGQSYNQLTGGRFAGPIWKEAMEGALKGVPAHGFTAPDAKYLRGDEERVPDLAGFKVNHAVRELENLGLGVQVEQNRVRSRQPRGSVAFTSPGAGASVHAGDLVRIFVSAGGQPVAEFTLEPAGDGNGNGRGGGGGGGGPGGH
jgi:membrane peptidoglycan carboxypeptidase